MSRHDPRRFRADYYAHEALISPRYADLDDLGHINNLALASIFEDAAGPLLHGLRLLATAAPADASSSGHIMIVSLKVDFRSETHYLETVTVHTGMSRIGRSSFSTEQMAVHDRRVVALSDGTSTYVEADRSVALPSDLARALARASVDPVPPTTIRD